jgi:hypothetical protein
LASSSHSQRLSPRGIFSQIGELNVTSSPDNKDDRLCERLSIAACRGGTSGSPRSRVKEEVVVRVLEGLSRGGGGIHEGFNETGDGEVFARGKEIFDARDEIVEADAADAAVAESVCELVERKVQFLAGLEVKGIREGVTNSV